MNPGPKSSTTTPRSNNSNIVGIGNNQWRKGKLSLARQIQAKSNTNPNADPESTAHSNPKTNMKNSHTSQNSLKYNRNPHYVHQQQQQQQQQHSRPTSHQWRNPYGRNSVSAANNPASNMSRNKSTDSSGSNGSISHKRLRYPNAHQYSNQYQYTGNGNGNGRMPFDPSTWINDPLQLQQLTASLYSTLDSHGVLNHGKGAQLRLNVLNRLETLLNEWAQSLLPSDRCTSIGSTAPPIQTQIKSVGDDTELIITAKRSVRLISFGSYRLGVHAPDADLDLLALCPPHVSREEFFSSLVTRLKDDNKCSSIHPIPGAYTPVIKFYMDGIPIDLLFVRLVNGDQLEWGKDEEASQLVDDVIDTTGGTDIAQDADSAKGERESYEICPRYIRTEFQLTDDMLQDLDGPSSRSLNGVRVAQYLLEIIPNPVSFRLVLKTVKEWAQVHGLYSNVLGFLGGVNWAILVAWVCKRHPDAEVPTLLKVFFRTFSRWRWPNPVILTPIVTLPPQGLSPLTVWNPASNPRDRAQIMPIITPCYPSMNSSYNVAQPQLRRLKEELYQADKIMNSIAHGTSSSNGNWNGNDQSVWSELLKENGFFKDHLHYLQIRIIAKNEEDHRSWFGFCESRLRILIAGLDSVQYGTQAYPFAKFFTIRENGDGDEVDCITTSFFIALRFAHGIENVDLIDCTAEYSYSVNCWGDREPGMDLCIEHVLQKDLPPFVFKSDRGIAETDKHDGTQEQDSDADQDKSFKVESKVGPMKSEISTILCDMESPDDCLASPMKKAKIGRS